MTNIFDDPQGRFLAVVNDEGQYALWPASLDLPAGWTVTHEEDTREACLEYVQRHWTDMRPRSLARVIDGDR